MPTALIVEDEPAANRLLSMLIQLRGYRTESAFSGGEALEKIGREAPDIVFLDLMLPDIDGYEVCKTLKSQKETSQIPVVMVTARTAAENRLQGFGVGADDYIPKPYTPDQIFRAMEEADSWRHKFDGRDAEGEIFFDTRRTGESLRQLAQLLSLLLARTSLDRDSVSRIGVALKELEASADAWGQSQHVDLVASLKYLVQADRLQLTVFDHTGWLENRLFHEEGWRLWIVPVQFDVIDYDDTEGRVTFVKRFEKVDSPPAP